MTDPFVYGGREPATPLVLVTSSSYNRFFNKLSPQQQLWLEQNDFSAKAGKLLSIPATDGSVDKFVCGVCDLANVFAIADLPSKLPEGVYSLEGTGVKANLEALTLGWGLGSYQFNRYKSGKPYSAQVKLPNSSNHPRIQGIVASTCRVRDLINTPAEDMMPQHLSAVMAELAQTYAGEI